MILLFYPIMGKTSQDRGKRGRKRSAQSQEQSPRTTQSKQRRETEISENSDQEDNRQVFNEDLNNNATVKGPVEVKRRL